MSLPLVGEQIACRDKDDQTEGIVNSEADNADDKQSDTIADAGDMEDVSVENADLIEATNNENAQHGCSGRSKKSRFTPRSKNSVVQQQRAEATSSRSLLPELKTRTNYKQKGKDDVRQEAIVIYE